VRFSCDRNWHAALGVQVIAIIVRCSGFLDVEGKVRPASRDGLDAFSNRVSMASGDLRRVVDVASTRRQIDHCDFEQCLSIAPSWKGVKRDERELRTRTGFASSMWRNRGETHCEINRQYVALIRDAPSFLQCAENRNVGDYGKVGSASEFDCEYHRDR
jgi:hypothetical protein